MFIAFVLENGNVLMCGSGVVLMWEKRVLLIVALTWKLANT